MVKVRGRGDGSRAVETAVPADRRRRQLFRVAAAAEAGVGRPDAKPSTRRLRRDYSQKQHVGRYNVQHFPALSSPSFYTDP